MADSVLIPAIRFDAAPVGRRHSFHAWRETVRCVCDVEPLTDGAGETERVYSWLVDRLIFSEVAFSRQAFSHGTKQARDANYLSLQIYRTGASTGMVGDQKIETAIQ